jgi:hypothetical protein
MMLTMRGGLREKRNAFARSLLCLAAVVPFVPDARQFFQRGVPDLLFTGDGAALELGTLHAARGVQLLGPYSRFGWSHPGPAYFYLALPFYEVFRRHGPALNVFALTADCAAGVAIVLTAHRLRGMLFALAVAALLAVYELVGLPFLLANEWNPIVPILPLVLLCFLAVRFALGHTRALPSFAFVASVVVQTHIAYGPDVLALAAFAGYARRRLARERAATGPPKDESPIRVATAGILVLCWMLPLYEAMTTHPGNLQQLVAFFAPRHLSEHPWGAAIRTVFEQMAVMPLALLRTLHVTLKAPRWSVTLSLAVAQFVALVLVLVSGVRRRDASLSAFATIVLVQIAVAVVAVRAIRGDIEFYLVAWVSVLGLLSSVVLVAWLVSALERVLGGVPAGAMVAVSSIVLLALALSEPVTRGPIFRSPDLNAARLARIVEVYLTSTSLNRPMVRIVTDESWPTAVAVVLYLYKHGIPISVEDHWITVVGKPFTAPAGQHPDLLFGNRAFEEDARTRADLRFVGAAGDVYVYSKGGT